MGDKSYWDKKFESRGNKPLGPDQMLVDHLGLLKKGHVLDLACGDGRNSLYLLDKGFDVSGVDFSEQALKRLSGFSKSVQTYQRDLSQKNALNGLGKFDNVLVNHYRLSSDLVKEIPNLLNEKGIFFVSGFSQDHEPDEKIGYEDLIRKDDFKQIEGKMTLIKSVSYKDTRGDFITYVFVLND